VSKKVILITTVAAVASFAGAFTAGWGTAPKAAQGSSNAAQEPQDTGGGPRPILTPSAPKTADGPDTRAMAEEQLKELIYEVREKIKDYDTKLQDLEKEKARLFVTKQTLKKDIETLNTLRVDLDAAAANAKNERDMLAKAVVEVEKVEKRNLVAIAAAYDKMDATRAAEILTNMAMNQTQSGGNRGSNINDAVKILHFMQDRTKADVLAELVATEPALTALLCQKLKQITEGK